MATLTRYYPGGYLPAGPAQNRLEEYDGTAGTYTAWDAAGVVTSTRPLSASEVAMLAGDDTAYMASSNAATLQQQAQAALATNRSFIAATLTQRQNNRDAEILLLAQMVQALTRLALSQFDGTN